MKRTQQFLLIALLMILSTACQEAGEDTEMRTDPAPSVTLGMLQHTVFFYLNDDVTEDQKEQFEKGLEELLSIEEIAKSEIGVPGDTAERDVTDHSFGYSIFVWFETMEDYDVYADHPVHMDFIDAYENLWADVKVYDSRIIQTLD